MTAHPTMLLHHTVSDFVLRMALRQLTSSEGKLSVARTAVLKHTLRSIHRMMQSSGTSEGLRGLLDSSLLKSVKKIMQHRTIFGPSALALGMSCHLSVSVLGLLK